DVDGPGGMLCARAGHCDHGTRDLHHHQSLEGDCDMRSISKICLLGASLALSACASLDKFFSVDSPTTARQVTAQSPAFDTAYQEGKAHRGGVRDGLAIVAFSRALALKPASVAALNALGTAYDGLGRYDIAQTYYRRALALEPEDVATANNLAVSLHLAGQPEAREMLERAQQLAPGNRTIRDNLAR